MKYSEYIEKKIHGSMDFPIQLYKVDKNNAYYVMQAHWHKEFEIIRVISGRLDVYLNNTKYSLKDGDIIFVECGCLHRGDPKNAVYECLVFDLGMLRRQQQDTTYKFISPIVNGELGVNCLLTKDNSLLYSVTCSLFETMKNPSNYFELDVYALLFKLFCELYKNGFVINTTKMQKGHQINTISRIIEYIDENYTENISLNDIAVFIGLSEKYICRIFKEYTSKTIIEYINEIRIDNACHDMIYNNKTVTQAAFDNGFNDLSYFSKVFKSSKHQTPSNYVKLHKKSHF